MTADCKRPYNVQASEHRKMKKVLEVCRACGGVISAWSVPDIFPDEIPAEWARNFPDVTPDDAGHAEGCADPDAPTDTVSEPEPC